MLPSFCVVLVPSKEDEASISNLRPRRLYSHALADCVDNGGLFTPLIDNAGHQPVLSKMRRNFSQIVTGRFDMNDVWTGVTRINATHFADGKGAWINTDQIEYSNVHRSCSSQECSLLFTLYANVKNEGTRIEWFNDLPGGWISR